MTETIEQLSEELTQAQDAYAVAVNAPEAVNEFKPPEVSGAEEIRFDKEAAQTVPICFVEDGMRYEVAHGFYVEALSDKALAAFDEQRKLQLVSVPDEPGATETQVANPNAEVDYWREQISFVRGYGEPGAELPDGWRDQVPDGDKEEAVKLLLAAEIVAAPPPKKAAFRAFGARRGASGGIALRCYFDGYQLTTRHFLREATAEDNAQWKALSSGLRLKAGRRIGEGATEIPAQMAAKAKLYDQMVTSYTGYAGHPPLHHKALVVSHHFGRVAQVLEKN